MDAFPLPAGSGYSYASRFTRDHRGTDIFAKRGTAVVAVIDGMAYRSDNPKGGRCVYLHGGRFSSQQSFYYAHLDWVDPALPDRRDEPGTMGVEVMAGMVLGHVGNTGNAAGTPPHLHFQMKKRLAASMTVVNPFPYLQAVDPKLKPGYEAPAKEDVRVEPGSEPGTGERTWSGTLPEPKKLKRKGLDWVDLWKPAAGQIQVAWLAVILIAASVATRER